MPGEISFLELGVGDAERARSSYGRDDQGLPFGLHEPPGPHVASARG